MSVFLYEKHRTTRPRHPVHSFTYDPQTDHATSSGGSRPRQVTIKLCRSELPVETLEKTVRKGFPNEQTRRVLLMMKRMGLLS